MITKDQIQFEQMIDILQKLNGEPIPDFDKEEIRCKTICHQGSSHKLYYYNNTHLFHCYTQCLKETFDIFYLVSKVKEISYSAAMEWVCIECGVPFFPSIEKEKNDIGWESLNRYRKLKEQNINVNFNSNLKVYDGSFLNNLPHPQIKPWLDEGITQRVMDSRKICYNPTSGGIVIPHYDINNNLIGIRERTLIKDKESKGKYMPMIMNNKIYSHPLGANLYNLNYSKNNIKVVKQVIVGEGEKFCLAYSSIFGEENDITVASCGSTLSKLQFNLLISLGVREIILAFDRQFQKIGDEEYNRWIQKLQHMAYKYRSFCEITFMFDTDNLLDYKDSPIDKGKEVFQTMFKKRLNSEGRIRK